MSSAGTGLSTVASRARSWTDVARYLSLTARSFAFIAIAAGLAWLVEQYATALRDPRYLDGWLLASGMMLQLWLHVARKSGRLTPRSAIRLRSFHVFLGYLLMAVFLLHVDFSWPDTVFEWALWSCFLLVALSGLFGTLIAASLQARRTIDEAIGYERIPERRAELARELESIVLGTDPAARSIPLPNLPHDDWISDLHANRLSDFFQGPRNRTAHLFGSQLPLDKLIGEIDTLSRYVDERGRSKLAAVKELVLEKDRLDFASVQLSLNKAWLLVHVPVTYMLLVLSVMHVLVAYAHTSSGG